ncbi:MAG: type II secretion system protein N, partial [Syntrophobacteria bacterium]
MAKKQKSKNIRTNISPDIETRIVELSLQNPDYGASRLVPLLEHEGMTVTTSAVYTLLKRNNLQNRTLRLSRLEELRAAEIAPEPVTSIEPQAEEPDQLPAHTIEMTPESSVSPVLKSLSKFTGRRFWPFAVPSLLVLGLVGYFLVSAAANFLRAGREPVLAPHPAPSEATTKAEATVRPLEDYSIIIERNLFGSSAAETPAPEETVSLEDIPAAEKSLGLKLVGTVVGDDAATSFAIIDNKTT